MGNESIVMNSDTEDNSPKVFTNLKFIYLSLGALIAGIISFESQLKKLIESHALEYLLLFIDLFKIEILTILIFLIFGGGILSIIKSSAIIVLKMVVKGELGELHISKIINRVVGIFIIIIIIGVCSVSCYHLWYLGIGKYISITNYHRALIVESETAFKKGDIKAAKSKLITCIGVVFSSRCKSRLAEINKRISQAENMRNLMQSLKRSNYFGRIKLAEDIYYLEKNMDSFQEILNSVKDDLKRIKIEYITALNFIMSGDIEKAEKYFINVNKKLPGYGDSHILLREIKKLKKILE